MEVTTYSAVGSAYRLFLEARKNHHHAQRFRTEAVDE